MRPGFSVSARSWLVGVGLLITIGVSVGIALAPTIAQAGAGETLMACENWYTATSNVFSSAPQRCALHYSNRPFDGNDTAPIEGIRWSGWGTGLARGYGTFHGNMDYTSPATIVLTNKRRCRNGTRNYTQARLTTSLGTSTGPLAACQR